MATYYWVGGTGTWSNTATTNWATSSGGAGGAGVPTSADDVVFNSSSNATGYTVTVSTGAVCKSMTANGPASGTVTFSGSATWTFYGSVTLGATGVSINCDCPMVFAATTTGNTITTNGVGVTSGNWTFSGSGVYTLGSALLITQALIITAGTFNTGNYSIIANAGFSFSGGTINLGSSTITPAAFFAGFAVGGTATLNAGTSTLNMISYNGGVDIGGRTLYNVNFFGMSQANFTSAATMSNLTIDLASGGGTLTLYANITVTGTFSTINATNAAVRVFLQGSGAARTITAAATSLTDIDFYNITGAGTASPFTGSRFSDYGGNSNIIFSTPKTVYWNLSGSRSWTEVAWATTSGGTANGLNYPLIQDTAVIDNNGAANTITIPGIGGGTRRVGAIDATSRTLPFSMSSSNYVEFYGNVKLGSAVSGSLPAYLNFVLRSPTTEVQIPINAATYTFTGNGSQNVVLTGALSSTNYGVLGESSIRTSNAGLITNGYSITAPSVRIESGTQTVDFGNSVITCTSINVASGNPEPFNLVSGNLLANSSTIVLSSTSNAAARTFAGGGKSYGTLTINGGNTTSQVVYIGGSNSFKAINSDKTVAWTLQFVAGTNNSFETWSLNGSSGNLLTLGSTSTSAATLTYTGTSNVSFDYASVSYISGRPANFKWFAGANSTDGGNNSAVYFRTPIDPSKSNFFMFF